MRIAVVPGIGASSRAFVRGGVPNGVHVTRAVVTCLYYVGRDVSTTLSNVPCGIEG